MTLGPPTPDTTSDAPPAPRCHDAASAVDDRGRTFRLTPEGVVVEGGGRRRVLALDDPGRPPFLRLPRIDLPDGRPLRRVAFDLWAAHLRARLVGGEAWETTYVARKPYHTAFAILGATLLGGGSLWAVLRWASSDPQVRSEPGLAGALALAAAVGLLLWVSFATLTSAVRFWLCRRGSFVRIDAAGVTFARGARPRPASDVAAAIHHAWLRVTEVRLRSGARLWIPRERGPLVRLDVVLAALPGGPPADV